ncbi:hypothetical protein Syun_011915 [Stephania yunnanensis]|uniref:Uncharacterized protein n=1 Tax=Stephania yunnanensis TaxID=152371 RepID=A0AAP0K0P8_9MAGN
MKPLLRRLYIQSRLVDDIPIANDDHPSHDIFEGLKVIKEVYEALRSSPQWNEFEVPIIDYHLALFFQPLLLLGITIGVTTIGIAFPFWLVTILIVILFLGLV